MGSKIILFCRKHFGKLGMGRPSGLRKQYSYAPWTDVPPNCVRPFQSLISHIY